MNNIEVRYYTQTGNSKKLADAIAKELGVTSKSIDEPVNGNVDIMFLANSVYWAGVDKHVKQFLRENSDKIGELVNVSTAALIESTYEQMKKLTGDLGIKLSDKEFHCRGSFTALHAGHPNAADLAAVCKFAKNICK
ncbi:MAG: flavodoxin [Lachnospiraceae bacterium]|nr:flavodoxin [Lachnospiraceae bacterium]